VVEFSLGVFDVYLQPRASRSGVIPHPAWFRPGRYVRSPCQLPVAASDTFLSPHPSVAEPVSEPLRHIAEIDPHSGVTALIVQQKVREVLRIARRVYILRNRQVTFEGPREALDDAKLREVYL